ACPSACPTRRSSDLLELAEQGKVKVVYRPFHLFGQQRDPIKSNSLRSAAAALCVPADKWISYQRALFKFQPAEGAKGFSHDDLVKWGKNVGVTDANFEKCVREEEKKPQVDQMTTYALQERGVQGTPTVFLDGQELGSAQFMDPGGLRAVVEAAAASGK